ncbi:TPA: hypothetical protein ACP62H_004571, partial [Escherichia coli]
LLMNKKFKYKKSLLAAILSATLLAGCDGGGSGSSSDTPPVDSGTGSLPEVKPDPTPNPEPTPEPTPESTIALTELGDEVRGANIDQLIHRYSKAGQNHTRV